MAAGANALYSCTENGRTRYVSAPEQCAGGAESRSTQKKKPPKTGAKKAAKSRTPGKFSRISPQKQRTLDKMRGDILLYELKSEVKVKNLMETLIGQTPPANARRLEVLQQRRREHALNITAIRQELARLGIYADYSGN